MWFPSLDGIAAVKDVPFFAQGNFIADDTIPLQAAIDFCYGPKTAPHGIEYFANRPLFIPPGHYRITAPLNLTKVQGAVIFGAGRFTTTIENTTPGQAVIQTNGMGYSKLSGLNLTCAAAGICLDLDYDGAGGGAALQANTIEEVFCDGSAGGQSIGVRIGHSGYMGSECIFKMLHTQGCGLAGVQTENFNALQHQFYGGQDQSCGIGIGVVRGSAPVISGRGFQLNTGWDIRIDSSANDTVLIQGCRSESQNFAKLGAAVHGIIQACSHTGLADGTFAEVGGSPVTIDRSVSVRGNIPLGRWSRLAVRGSSFGRMDWLTNVALMDPASYVEVADVIYNGTPNSSPSTSIPIKRQRIDYLGAHDYALAN